MFKRIQTLSNLGDDSCFLWGARQTGKSTLLKTFFPTARRYDLLLSNEFLRLNQHPALLREELLAEPPGKVPVIIDEVQKVPALLDEVQWLIVNAHVQFILCGSSARKLRRGGANLLGGRALRYELYPLVSAEIPNFDLVRTLNHGLLPRHYLANDATKLIQAYVGEYLQEEIAAEALTRNIPAFARFLEVAAFSNGDMVNYKKVGGECGVNPVTVKEYFQILVDTLLGAWLPSYQKRPKRRVIQAPRFFFFDVGVTNCLLKRGKILPKSESFGRAFAHFIYQELRAHSHYSGLDYPISYWKTASQIEVDFILGDHQLAVEVKSSASVSSQHLHGVKAFAEEYAVGSLIVVSQDPKPRRIGNVQILPWQLFLQKLWSGELIR